MRYYPIFLDLDGKSVIFSGAGDHAAAKIRLLLKTTAKISVFGEKPSDDILDWASVGKLTYFPRQLSWDDVCGAKLVYGANDDLELDRHAVELGRWAGALTNIVDNLEESDFLTPALVDRDPVTIAIGTEGTAPVLARKIKSEIEELVPASTGLLARIANSFRPIASTLDSSRLRRDFWSRYFFVEGPKALAQGGRKAVGQSLETLFVRLKTESLNPVKPQIQQTGSVDLIGTGPGDPELLTIKARRLLHEADVVLHDQLVPAEILELARREAILVNVGKKGFGKSWKQEDINQLMIEHASRGHRIARLKSGDPVIFGRLDEELDALEEAGVSCQIIPGITAASAAAANINVSLTRRGRNSSLTFLTGHDVSGFADHDWKELAKPGATSAIYMGLKAATYIRGRLMMHGAQANTPVTIVANASRPNQQIIRSSLLDLPKAIKKIGNEGPAVLLYGLKPRKAVENSILEQANEWANSLDTQTKTRRKSKMGAR